MFGLFKTKPNNENTRNPYDHRYSYLYKFFNLKDSDKLTDKDLIQISNWREDKQDYATTIITLKDLKDYINNGR